MAMVDPQYSAVETRHHLTIGVPMSPGLARRYVEESSLTGIRWSS